MRGERGTPRGPIAASAGADFRYAVPCWVTATYRVAGLGQIAARCQLAVLGLLALMSCDPFHTQFEQNEAAVTYRAAQLQEVTTSGTLKVLTYNVKFAGGRIDFFFDCHGDRVLMSEKEVLDNIEGIAAVIEALDPDIVFLQEIDVLSKRAAYVDQVQWLLDHTDLNYGVYASQWKADYVPSDGLGPVNSGNAILAKSRLSHGRRIALPLRTDQGGLTKYFYLRRNMLVADLAGEVTVRLVGTHTDAYSQDGTTADQIALFETELDNSPGLVIGAGDLNALPPGSAQVSMFPDSACTDEDFQADDYSANVDVLSGLYEKYEPAIPLADYHADNDKYFTHTTDSEGYWNRKLDYVFTNASVVAGSGVTHQDASTLGFATMPLSDHAPLSVEIALP